MTARSPPRCVYRLRRRLLRLVLTTLALAILVRADTPRAEAADASASSAIDTIYLVPETHLDIGFTAPPADVAELYKAMIDQVIEHATAAPDFRWTVSQVWMVDQWLARTRDVERISRFFALVREGRISIAAGYANQHTAMMGEEETARFFYPARRLAEEHGIETETLIVADVPGWSWSLPQAMARAGVKYFLAGPNNFVGGVADIPRSRLPFYWRGPDGSQVLTWLSHEGYAGLARFGLTPDTRLEDMDTLIAAELAGYEAEGYPYDAILVMAALGDNVDSSHFAATWLRTRIALWNGNHARPKFVLATPEEFFRHMEAAYAGSFATESGNSSGAWDGLNTITPSSTAMVRWAHDHAPAAEKLNAVNQLLGSSPNHEAGFDIAYTWMLQSDEHCIGSMGWPGLLTKAKQDEDNAAQFEFATNTRTVTASLLAGELVALGLAARSAAHARIVVYNSLSWRRTAPVEAAVDAEVLARGFELRRADAMRTLAYQKQGLDRIVFVAEDVPAFGYQAYELVPTRSQRRFPKRFRAREGRLSNRYYDVRVDPADGRIISIWDRRACRELVQTKGSFDFNALIKAPNLADFLVEAEASYEQLPPAGAPEIASFSGPVSASLTITRTLHPLARTEIILYDDLPRVDIVDTLDRREMEYVPYAEHSWHYSLTFPFDLDLRDLVTRVETTAGFLAPPLSGYLPGANTGTQLSQHAIDLREGNAYGVTVAHREAFSSTVGRVNRYAYDPLQPTLIFRTVQDFDEGLTRDLGVVPIQAEPVTVQGFAFSLTTNKGFSPIAVTRFGWDFATPLQAQYVPAGPTGALGGAASGSFLSLDAVNVILLNFKRAQFGDRSDFIVRVREIAGKPTTATLQTAFVVLGAQAANLVEGPLPDSQLPSDPVRFEIGPYEVKTIRLKIGAWWPPTHGAAP